jgi:tetratricopeptide (TPR) repeat protein
VSTCIVNAQQQDLELANQYFQQSEFEKAKVIYDKLLKNDDNRIYLYDNYLSLLISLKQYTAAEKFIIKTRKKYPQSPKFSVDLILFYQLIAKTIQAEKEISKLKDQSNKDEEILTTASNYLIEKRTYDIARDLYLSARSKSGNPHKYAFELADIYKQTGKIGLLIDELLHLLQLQPGGDMLISVQNSFQNSLTTKEDFEMLESKILSQLQINPDNSQFVELITWLYIQQRDFYKAYIQAKAFDKRNKLQGVKMIELGLIVFKNKDYENAALIFDYVKSEYPSGSNFHTAMYYGIQVKESLIQNTYPVDKQKIQGLINDYQQYLTKINQHNSQIEVKKSMAKLYAFYLNDVDNAIKLLEESIVLTRDPSMLAKLKMDLGDVKLLKNEIWDASLLYSQAEKLVKDSPLGYEAKFRNAKLFYYKGEFLLAQEQLNILKQATTREISNDAIQLSVFIQDQLLIDSTSEVLIDYSKIELLIFKNEFDLALVKLDTLLKHYPQDKIRDDIYWLQAKVFIKIGKFEKAAEKLQYIVDNYNEDIYGDDAYFNLAELYQEKLNNVDKAKQMYEALLVKYPGSIFVPESRKRFRILRGDKL